MSISPLKHPQHVGFSLIELLAVVAIVTILAAILLPVVGRMKDNASTTKTMSNLRQLQMANLGYQQDRDGMFVSAFNGGSWGGGWKWNTDFLSYLSTKVNATNNSGAVLRSGFPQPAANIAYNISKVPSGYFWSGGVKMELRQNQIASPETMIAFVDSNDWWVNPSQWNAWKTNKNDMTNNPSASVAYRNKGKAAAVTFAGTVVMLTRDDLNTGNEEGRRRWWYDGKP